MAGIVLLSFGVVILASSLPPVYALIGMLKTKSLQRYWQILMLLIFFFIISFIYYCIFFWNELLQGDLNNMILPIIFFSGSCFIWVTSKLFHKTSLDLSRLNLLEEENITDPLIGIYNRRYLDRRIASEVALARRHELKLSILMVDIDHFKEINDSYGHQAGDLVLHHLGKMILGTIRQSDVAARYGGEEIVIIAPETDAASADTLAERLRRGIAAHELMLENGGEKALNITVSIGVAELSEQTRSAEQLIDSSDVAMYQAKKAGRNRVRVYQSATA